MSIVLVGSTSGSCTLQEQAVAGNTTLTLPTVSGTILTTGSSGQSIPRAALPTGSILQVVNSNLTTAASTTSGTPTTTGLSATITPTSSSSRILVLVTGIGSQSEASGSQGAFRMVRNIPSSNTVVDNQATSGLGFGTTAAVVEGARTRQPVTFSLYDSPATTSAITYTLQFFTTSTGTVFLGRWGNDANWIQSTNLTLLEIAA